MSSVAFLRYYFVKNWKLKLDGDKARGKNTFPKLQKEVRYEESVSTVQQEGRRGSELRVFPRRGKAERVRREEINRSQCMEYGRNNGGRRPGLLALGSNSNRQY